MGNDGLLDRGKESIEEGETLEKIYNFYENVRERKDRRDVKEKGARMSERV